MDSIDYYNKHATIYFENTVEQDLTSIRDEFLSYLPKDATILDLGCGSGRDSLAFYNQGYDVTALDASFEMCQLAEIHTGMEVLHMDFQKTQFHEVFDGIWACASLVHIPKADIQDLVNKALKALKSEGILYISFRFGDFEGHSGERYFSDYTEDAIYLLLGRENNREIVKIWLTDDRSNNHKEKKWINTIIRKSIRKSQE